jgi:hypothetical protein
LRSACRIGQADLVLLAGSPGATLGDAAHARLANLFEAVPLCWPLVISAPPSSEPPAWTFLRHATCLPTAVLDCDQGRIVQGVAWWESWRELDAALGSLSFCRKLEGVCEMLADALQQQVGPHGDRAMRTQKPVQRRFALHVARGGYGKKSKLHDLT